MFVRIIVPERKFAKRAPAHRQMVRRGGSLFGRRAQSCRLWFQILALFELSLRNPVGWAIRLPRPSSITDAGQTRRSIRPELAPDDILEAATMLACGPGFMSFFFFPFVKAGFVDRQSGGHGTPVALRKIAFPSAGAARYLFPPFAETTPVLSSPLYKSKLLDRRSCVRLVEAKCLSSLKLPLLYAPTPLHRRLCHEQSGGQSRNRTPPSISRG